MLDADETDPEDYNIRSKERTKLLIKLKGVLNDVPISPAFWACCHLGDKTVLSELITRTRGMPNLLLVNEEALAFIPMLCKLLALMLYCSFDYRYAHG